jgi:hypothetical protein
MNDQDPGRGATVAAFVAVALIGLFVGGLIAAAFAMVSDW